MRWRARSFPPGAVFGDGWSLVEVSPPQSRDLEEGTLVSSQAIYLGPRGARILVARLELPETLDGYEAGLHTARAAFDAWKERTIDSRGRPEDVETREFRLESAPRVANCMAMQRVEGPDMDGTQTSVGLSLCIAEPNLTGARLVSADLAHADLRNAILQDAHLEDANLSSVTGLTQAQIDTSYMNANTVLPNTPGPNGQPYRHSPRV